MFDDAAGVTLLILVGFPSLVLLFFGLRFLRRPGRTSPPPSTDRRDGEVTEDGPRPQHRDPDPERLAGGRARFTPPDR
jgi:hypothetical protein